MHVDLTAGHPRTQTLLGTLPPILPLEGSEKLYSLHLTLTLEMAHHDSCLSLAPYDWSLVGSPAKIYTNLAGQPPS